MASANIIRQQPRKRTLGPNEHLCSCSGQTAFQLHRLLASATLPRFGGGEVHGAVGKAEAMRADLNEGGVIVLTANTKLI